MDAAFVDDVLRGLASAHEQASGHALESRDRALGDAHARIRLRIDARGREGDGATLARLAETLVEQAGADGVPPDVERAFLRRIQMSLALHGASGNLAALRRTLALDVTSEDAGRADEALMAALGLEVMSASARPAPPETRDEPRLRKLAAAAAQTFDTSALIASLHHHQDSASRLFDLCWIQERGE